jgi:hypothetical protein
MDIQKDLGCRCNVVCDHDKTSPSYKNLLLPWNKPELESWSIVGMNHYFANGVKHLYVAMVHKDMNYAIYAEGTDEVAVFDQLTEEALRLI